SGGWASHPKTRRRLVRHAPRANPAKATRRRRRYVRETRARRASLASRCPLCGRHRTRRIWHRVSRRPTLAFMRSVLVLSIVSTLLGAACSSKVADKYPSIESFCQAKAQEECQVSPRCGVTAQACQNARAEACTNASLTTI